MGLSEYKKKRKFKETPEPAGKKESSKGPLTFVIHEHHATRLHYDLRLEMGGVLKSWAVPKGPPESKNEKRLAVHVEDHPLEYGKFEGLIPKGNYGAGTVKIWDAGALSSIESADRDESEKILEKEYSKGHMRFLLVGSKLNGFYHLVRMKGNQWLFMIADEEKKVKTKKGKDSMPHEIKPMLAKTASEPFNKDDWFFEYKWDGWRAIAETGKNIALYSRNGLNLKHNFPEIVQELSKIKDDAVLDGEIIALDNEGKINFGLLQNAGNTPTNTAYIIFDLLYIDGNDLREEPLTYRKKLLRDLLQNLSPRLFYSEHVVGDGISFYEIVKQEGIEGMMAKDANSKYIEGRSEKWLKIKNVNYIRNKVVHSIKENDISLTNMDKIFWPKEGYTKGDVIAYYDQMADIIMPYLKDRPQSLLRHPNGIEGKSFFHKNIEPKMVPPFAETYVSKSDSKEKETNYLVCNNKDTLLFMANLGCIEINPWSSRTSSPENPDFMIIDLDPVDRPFDDVIRVAQAVKKVLDISCQESFIKTSGKRGLHILVPLLPIYTYDDIRIFSELMVKMVHEQIPEITSLERSPAKRKGKVYLDHLQNRKGQTLACPYSLRPWPGATVSTPLSWSEIKKGLRSDKFSIKNISKRIKEKGDLWKNFYSKPTDLAQAIKCMDENMKKSRPKKKRQ